MVSRLLVANRGEIAVRILRAAADLGIGTVAVYSADDARGLHTRKADEAHPLAGAGAAAYLDAEQIIAAAVSRGCDAIHPGYGFLSEQPHFARALRRGGAHVRRPGAGDARAVRRQDPRPRSGPTAAGCRCCRHSPDPISA